MVDVRDVALAHLRALEAPEAAGQRIIINSRSLWCKDIGTAVASKLGDKYPFSTDEVKFCMMRFLGSFFSGEDAEMKAYKNIWGKS